MICEFRNPGWDDTRLTEEPHTMERRKIKASDLQAADVACCCSILDILNRPRKVSFRFVPNLDEFT
jgi:hypothetical protein